MKTFTLPDLGEGLQEAEIVAWHVSEGEKVATDQPLLSVETDKAVVEIPSPYPGAIAKLHGQPGEVLPIGAPLVDFDDGEAAADKGTVVGAISTEETVIDETAPTASAPGKGAPGIKAPPAVRALARKLDVDLSVVGGSGPDGAVTADDVKRAAKALSAVGPAEPLRGVRRAMAHKMAQSHAEVVPATLFDEADIDGWAEGADITVRLIRAIAVACKAEPALNVWYDSGADSRRVLAKIDLGLAVDTEEGLFVPVIRDVGARDAADLRAGLDALKADVRARAIPMDELRGASISLSNFGMMAGRYAQLVVVPPQVAIIGAGAIGLKLSASGGEIAGRRVLPLSLTFDHRVVTGGEAARFMGAMIAELAQPE